MKKYLIVIVVAVLLVAGWFAYELYAYYNPECGFYVGKPLDEESDTYIETLVYQLGEKSVFGMPKSYYTDSEKVIDNANKLMLEILDEYSAPMHITLNYAEDAGKTIISYEGNAVNKTTGLEENVRKALEMDFIVGERGQI